MGQKRSDLRDQHQTVYRSRHFQCLCRTPATPEDLGVDILWFMPIHPIGELNRKGSLGSYYSVRDYKAVNPEFGTMEDFKNLVNKAHELGFKVILDWVANHTSFDHQWATDHPEWYTRDEKGNIVSPFDWTDVADLKYDNNPALWDAMIDALKFWVVEANIDGYRCDVAGMVPVAFWEKARTELDAVKPVFMLAEDEGQRDLMKKAFDANYGWEFHHIMNNIAKGEKNAADVWAYFAKEDTLFAPTSFRMMMTSNHDENSWNGTEFERMGDGAKAFAVMAYTIPGFPMMYNGQEVALNKRLLFFEKIPSFGTNLLILLHSTPNSTASKKPTSVCGMRPMADRLRRWPPTRPARCSRLCARKTETRFWF